MKPTGEWSSRVRFSAVGGFAYRPGEILVPSGSPRGGPDKAGRSSGATARGRRIGRPEEAADSPIEEVVNGIQLDDRPGAGHHRVSGVVDELDGIEELRSEGIPVHPNYVLVLPLPMLWVPARGVRGQPVLGQPVLRQPLLRQPVLRQPLLRQPVLRQPVLRQPVLRQPLRDVPDQSAWQCRRSPSGRRTATEFRTTGWRPHSARPGGRPDLPAPVDALLERRKVRRDRHRTR